MRLQREIEGRLDEENVGAVPKPFDVADHPRAVDEAWESRGGAPITKILRESESRPYSGLRNNRPRRPSVIPSGAGCTRSGRRDDETPRLRSG